MQSFRIIDNLDREILSKKTLYCLLDYSKLPLDKKSTLKDIVVRLGGTKFGTYSYYIIHSSHYQLIPTDLRESIAAHSLMLLPTLGPVLYSKIIPIIATLGGNWVEKYGGYLFINKPCINQDIEKCLSNHLIDVSAYTKSEIYQFYPTPEEVARRAVELAEIEEGDIVLEPSAGRGGILKHIPAYATPIAIEIDKNNIHYLNNLGYRPIHGDFLAIHNLRYNKVVMNPPFTEGLDVDHVLHAYKNLEHGGILVAIMNENSFYYKRDKFLAFREFLIGKDYKIEQVQDGAFKESNTSANTCILKIRKGVE